MREGTGEQLKDQVGAAVIELGVARADRARAVVALAARGAQPVGGDGSDIVLPAPLGAGSLRDVLGDLDAARIAPEHIGVRKPTLDEVFLTLTGHATKLPVPVGGAAR